MGHAPHLDLTPSSQLLDETDTGREREIDAGREGELLGPFT